MKKKYYYFSTTKLKFIEIESYRRKFVSLVSIISLLISFLIFGLFFILNVTINPNSQLNQLITENSLLKNKLLTVNTKLAVFSEKFDSLSITNNDLRLANNLEPITAEDRNLGIGGSVFNADNISNNSEVNELISSLDNFIESIETKIKLENKNYNEIYYTIDYNKKLFDAIPAIKPTTGNYGDRFGMRYHPILKIKRMHNGVDFLAKLNTPVYAPGSGIIEFADRKGGLGKTIVINHGFGYKTYYGHLNKYKVKKGQKVKRGDLIALSGNSGSLSTGPHLHYEVKHNGIALNPRNFIFDDVKIFDLAENINKE
ncbi:MAG: M23 family metallopeptidase [Bacteroidetes bacterium]|nr:M23 family metallopeptidase [Bacteroidota bacterium]MBU1113631.1 M23 family metallopeptidase [Bacteroidota bacterium]MBU1796793.1 M23 family metallopeptidase [Bacteroidota bacterium]